MPLRLCLCAIALAVLSIDCAARAPVALEPLAENVWVHASYREVPPWGAVLAQSLVVRTDGGAVIVDTAWDDADTERLLAVVRARVSPNIQALIVTHAHDDKMGGIRAAAAAGIRTYAHPFSNEDAPLRGLAPASAALFADGRTEQTLYGLEVFYPGAGHTRDNLVVYFAPARVLFGGCLVRPEGASDLGNTADASLADWADSVRAVAARFPDAEWVVPSHGAVGGRELLAHTIQLAEAAARR